jgi:hypothetical protein
MEEKYVQIYITPAGTQEYLEFPFFSLEQRANFLFVYSNTALVDTSKFETTVVDLFMRDTPVLYPASYPAVTESAGYQVGTESAQLLPPHGVGLPKQGPNL